jgi:hypothetical protein
LLVYEEICKLVDEGVTLDGKIVVERLITEVTLELTEEEALKVVEKELVPDIPVYLE